MDINKETRAFETLSGAMNHLKSRGFVQEFSLEKQGIKNSEGKYLAPADVHVKEMYRFEGASNPADNSVLYALETSDGAKGLLATAFGAYGSSDENEALKKIESD